MRMGQGVRTGLGQGASPVSYRHNFLVFLSFRGYGKLQNVRENSGKYGVNDKLQP